MKQPNAYQPFLISSMKKDHTITLSDLKWTTFEENDFLGDGEDWGLVLTNMLTEKSPELLSKITFGKETLSFCIHSEDKEVLRKIAEMVASFYENKAELTANIKRYAIY
ncbi:Imm51 family immunity protein [Psychromonas sp. MME2]|uniref:Imm51 family immunity protein n=1 Tax=unclassified Psychromonas TaxID=2614957 RepID=UPI00339CB0B7